MNAVLAEGEHASADIMNNLTLSRRLEFKEYNVYNGHICFFLLQVLVVVHAVFSFVSPPRIKYNVTLQLESKQHEIRTSYDDY